MYDAHPWWSCTVHGVSRATQAGARQLHTHLDVRRPPLVVGLEAHPALKDLAHARHVAKHLLHVDVLVPGGAAVVQRGVGDPA